MLYLVPQGGAQAVAVRPGIDASEVEHRCHCLCYSGWFNIRYQIDAAVYGNAAELKMQNKFEPLEYQREWMKLLEQQHSPGHPIKMVVSGRGRRPKMRHSACWALWDSVQEFTQKKLEHPK